MFNVRLCCFCCVMRCVGVMPLGQVRVMCCHFVFSCFMVHRGFLVVSCCMFVMFCCLLMMLRCLF